LHRMDLLRMAISLGYGLHALEPQGACRRITIDPRMHGNKLHVKGMLQNVMKGCVRS
jgi:hypothetical protein